MKRTRLANALMDECSNRREIAISRRNKLVKYVWQIKNKYSRGEISYDEYVRKIYEKSDGKTVTDRISEYERVIRECDFLIRKEKRKGYAKKVFVGVFLIFLFVLMINFSLNVAPRFVGFAVAEDKFIQQINLKVAENETYEWVLDNYGILDFVKVSGEIEGEGSVRIYLEDLLIFDSEFEGMGVENVTYKRSFITGQVIKENESSELDDEELYSDENRNETLSQQTSPLEEESYFSEINESLLEVQEMINVSFGVEENFTEKLIENITEEKINVSELEDVLNVTQVKNITEEVVRKFSEVCLETCDLSNLNLNKSSYVIKIEVDNAILSLEDVVYNVQKEEVSLEENVSEVNITTVQYGAVLGEPVKWRKEVFVKDRGKVVVEIPKISKKVNVKKIVGEDLDRVIEEISLNQIEILDEDMFSFETADVKFSLTGKVVSELEGESFLLRFFKRIFGALTGRVIEETEFIEVFIDDDAMIYEVEYETPAPYSVEEELDIGKRITVVGPEEVHYEEILAFTDLPVETSKDSIKFYRFVENQKVEFEFMPYDDNNNGLVERIEWVVPHLSNDTYQLEIIVLNVQSYPMVGGNWSVRFNTTGVADLKISAINETSFGEELPNDLKFLELRCGDDLVDYSWVNNSIFVKDYSCFNKMSVETSEVFTTGKHILEFDFGGLKAYAYNLAEKITTYTYADYSSKGHKAYEKGNTAPASPTNYELPEPDSTDYSNMQSSDNSYWSTSLADADVEYDSQIFHFNISEDEDNIKQLDFKWEGSSSEVRADYDLSFFIWNHVSSSWEQVQSDSDGSTGDVTWTKTITSSISNYVDKKSDGNWVYGYVRFEHYEGGLSCPFVYSYDGKNWTLDHESFPFSVMRSARTRTYDRLKFLEEVNGSYFLKIKEMLDERSFVDDFKFYLVDHKEEGFVMPDINGGIHVIQNLEKPISCFDKSNVSCLEKLSIDNNDSWIDNFYSVNSDDKNTYNDWVVLDFEKPENATLVKLFLKVKKQITITDIWMVCVRSIGANYWGFWEDFLDMGFFGDLFEKTLNNIIGLKVEVYDGNNWKEVGILRAGLDTLDDFLVVVNLTDISENELKVRLKSATGFYEIFYVAVDYSLDGEMRVNLLEPEYATFNKELDISKIIGEEDDEYVSFVIGDVIDLKYNLPPKYKDWQRDPYISIKGYYSILYDDNQSFWGFIKGVALWLEFLISPEDVPGLFRPRVNRSNTVYTDYVELKIKSDVGVEWNQSSLSLGNVYQGETGAGKLKVVSTERNTGVTVARTSGASFISANPTSVGTMNDAENQEITFSCSPSSSESTGTGQAVFKVSSNEDTTGQTVTVSCNVQEALLPKIINVWTNEMTDVSSGLNEGPASTDVSIKFTAYYLGGYSGLNDNSAKINFTKDGEDLRENLSCERIVSESSGNYANYSCVVKMWWWDGAGSWNIGAYIEDDNSNSVVNNSESFSVGATSGFIVSTSSLEWDEITPGAINMESASNPVILRNTGNVDKEVEINATNLRGEQDNSYALWAGNFSVHTVSGCEGTVMSYANFVSVLGASLPSGNYSVLDSFTGKEELYFCLEEAGSELIPQPYSTGEEGAWIIRIFTVMLTSGSRRKKKKVSKDDKLLMALGLIVDKLKEEYSLDKKELFEVVLEKMRKEYSLEESDVLETLNKDEKRIPVEIFSKDIGGLEVVCKYLKENLKMTYSEIARELGRDERTIWTAYNKTIEKRKESILIRDSKEWIPISVFKNKELTVLESIIFYLRNMGMKFSEIGKILDRDQRNVWTIHANAIKKNGRILEKEY